MHVCIQTETLHCTARMRVCTESFARTFCSLLKKKSTTIHLSKHFWRQAITLVSQHLHSWGLTNNPGQANHDSAFSNLVRTWTLGSHIWGEVRTPPTHPPPPCPFSRNSYTDYSGTDSMSWNLSLETAMSGLLDSLFLSSSGYRSI